MPSLRDILISTILIIISESLSESINTPIVNRTILRKCCPTDRFLNATENECVTLSDIYQSPENLPNRYDFITPVSVSGNNIYLKHGFINEINETSDYCVDKTLELNDTYPVAKLHIQATSPIEEANAAKLILTIQKCCPNGYAYDTKLHYCSQNFTEGPVSNFIMELYDAQPRFINYHYGLTQCRQAVVEVVNTTHRLTLTDNILKVIDLAEYRQELYTFGSYCLDDTIDGKIVAKVCRSRHSTCSSRVCIHKCCPDGQAFIKPSKKVKAKCYDDASVPFMPKFITKDENDAIVETHLDSFAIIPNYICSAQRYMISDDEADISATDGKLYSYSELKSVSTYCVDNVRTPNMKGFKKFQCFPNDASTNPKLAAIKEKRLRFYAVFLFISCLFLIATLLVYFCLPELQNLHGKTLMCHVVCLLIAYGSLGIAQIKILPNETQNGFDLCKLAGYIIVYMFLAAFSWLNVMCFDIWWTFGGTRSVGGSIRRRSLEQKRFLFYNIYAWGLPTIISFLVALTDHKSLLPDEFLPRVGYLTCFFDFTTYGYAIFFSIPLAIQSTCNVIFFVLTSIHCSKVKAEIHRMQAGSKGNNTKKRFVNDKAKLMMNMKLFVVMGVSWVYESLGMYSQDLIWLWYIGDIFNCLMGVPIFIIFVVKPKIWHLLRARLGLPTKKPLPRSATSTSVTDLRSKISISSARSPSIINPAAIQQQIQNQYILNKHLNKEKS